MTDPTLMRHLADHTAGEHITPEQLAADPGFTVPKVRRDLWREICAEYGIPETVRLFRAAAVIWRARYRNERPAA